MDAGAAARMSDPLLDPHFRRRWREVADERVPAEPEPATARLERLAELLSAEWRRRRTLAEGRDP